MFGFGKKKKKGKGADDNKAASPPQNTTPPENDENYVEALEDRVLSGKIIRQGGRLRVTVDEDKS